MGLDFVVRFDQIPYILLRYKNSFMNIRASFIFFILLFLFAALISCKSDDEFVSPFNNTLISDFEEPEIHVKDTADFNFLNELFGQFSTLTVVPGIVDASTGRAIVDGWDNKDPDMFRFDWGDGSKSEGDLPALHIYTDTKRNYIVKVTAHYLEGKSNSAEAYINFTGHNINPVSIPPEITVSIPDHDIILTSRYGYAPDDHTFFGSSYFRHIRRTDLEYILSAVAWLQYDFVNHNVYLSDGTFNQVILRNPDQEYGQTGSFWFTSPPAILLDDFGQHGWVDYGVLFDELGQGFTLNTPSDFVFGNNIDGNYNFMYRKGMALIFSLGAAWELINNQEFFGLCDAATLEIYYNIKDDYRFLHEVYLDYIIGGRDFTGWNYSPVNHKNTLDTYLVICYKFCSHAAQEGIGYKIPIQRMMKLLQLFNEEMRIRYNLDENTPDTDAMVATFLVTAMSYAFEKDLRQEFRDLNFPINDGFYDTLFEMVE